MIEGQSKDRNEQEEKREGKLKQTYNLHYKTPTRHIWLSAHTTAEVSTDHTAVLYNTSKCQQIPNIKAHLSQQI